MTSKSRLSHRLELCELIRQLDNDECVNVIRSVYKEFGCSTLNKLLIKMTLHLTDTVTANCFIKMKNIVKDIISTQNTHMENSHEKQKKQEKQEKSKNSTLIRLPIDLINKISLYLNEKDIFSFEQCCKLFYHMSNNLSYINQSNAFKTFNLTAQRLYQMTQKQHNFYKYSKATKLTVGSFATIEQQLVVSQHEKAKVVSSYDKWLTSMFKSIKNLEIDTDGTILLPNLPIDMLFDPDASKSNLETLTMYLDIDNINIDKFYEKYIILKKEFENQGKKIRVLNCSEQSLRYLPTNVWLKLFFIESKHTCVHAYDSKSSLKRLFETNFQFWNGDNNSSLEILTFKGCWFGRVDTTMINSNNINAQMQIKTLRLIDLSANSNRDILENGKLIESLNFHNSVKNLTVNCAFYQDDDCKSWTKVISNLLTKKHYFNLDNVNILLQFAGMYAKEGMVNWIFEILKANMKILKNQFKQLNIGIHIVDTFREEFERYCVLKWHCTIDDKFLIDYQQQCDTLGQDKQFEPSIQGQVNPYQEKYNLVLKQWLA